MTKLHLTFKATLFLMGFLAIVSCQTSPEAQPVPDDTIINPYADEMAYMPAAPAQNMGSPVQNMDMSVQSMNAPVQNTPAPVQELPGTVHPIPCVAQGAQVPCPASQPCPAAAGTAPCLVQAQDSVVIIQPSQPINVPKKPTSVANVEGYPIERFNAAQMANKQTTCGNDIPLAPMTSAARLNIETPDRCTLPFPTNEIITNIPLNPNDFKLTRLEKNDPLPRYEVNGYTFANLPIDVAIQNLVSEAGIQVFSDDGLFPELSAEDVRGELSAVVAELASAGDVYYRYDEAKKKIYLSRWARFELSVPGNRIGLYAVLDALRGAGITNVQADFGQNTLYFRVTKDKQDTILRLIDTLKEDPRLLLLDIKVYRLSDKPNQAPLDWQTVIQKFGVKRVNMSVNGIMGRMVITSHQRKDYTLVDLLKPMVNVTQVSQGVAIMPNSWKVRFDIGQCASFDTPEKDLSLLLQSNIQSADRIESNIALDTINGEITSFYSFYNVDDNLSIIGIPGSVFNPNWKSIEYMVTMKPRILRLVK